MKKGLNGFCFPKDWTLNQCFQSTWGAGFDGIELNLRETGEFSLQTSDSEIQTIALQAKKYGVEIPSLSTGLFWKYSLTDPDAETRARAMKIAKRLIDLAAILQIDTILVVPGVVHEKAPYDKVYACAQDALKILASYAGERGVVIGVENVWNKFLLSPLEMKQFIEEINHPAVKVYFDVGNVLVHGYPEQWIRILHDQICQIHVKDFRLDIGNIYGFTTLLHGDVNWAEVSRALHEIGYDGYVMAEVPPPSTQVAQFLVNLSRSIDSICTN